MLNLRYSFPTLWILFVFFLLLSLSYVMAHFTRYLGEGVLSCGKKRNYFFKELSLKRLPWFKEPKFWRIAEIVF